MKKNVWKELKKENNAKALNLEIEGDQRYLDKVTAYAVNQGVGMMETEIIRKGFNQYSRRSTKKWRAIRKFSGRCKRIYRKSGYRRKKGEQKRPDLLLYSRNRKIFIWL